MSRIAEVEKAGKDAARDMSDTMSNLKSELSGIAASAYEEGKTRGRQLMDIASREGSRMMERSGEVASQAKAQAGDLAIRTQDMVRARPAAALGVAVGLGLLIGLLSRRR